MKNRMVMLFMCAIAALTVVTSCSSDEDALRTSTEVQLGQDADFQTFYQSLTELAVIAVQQSWSQSADEIRRYAAVGLPLTDAQAADFERAAGITYAEFSRLNAAVGQSLDNLMRNYPTLATMGTAERNELFRMALDTNPALTSSIISMGMIDGRCFLFDLCMTVGTFFGDILHDFMCANGWDYICEGGFDGDILGDIIDSAILQICSIFPC